ncbi:hypothetical protein [Algoriphagus terrigena]|uniref:hypothetical protein n=1 Tax=Algoriphagus terrigena TaxID=344884 RepID=UPI00054D8597|nr:hypothetical protein [Algoriphagus terrigena]
MKKQFLLLSLLAMALFSCEGDDAQDFALVLDGTYEAVLQSEGRSAGTKMTFKGDGSLLVERFVILGDSGVRCHQNYQLGTYSLVNEDFVFTINESYGPDPLINYSICPSKEDLVPQLGSEPLPVAGTLVLSNAKKNFNLSYECPELLPYMCLGSNEFELTTP